MLRMLLNTVTPAHSSGAYSAGLVPGGMRIAASLLSVVYSASAPWSGPPVLRFADDDSREREAAHIRRCG